MTAVAVPGGPLVVILHGMSMNEVMMADGVSCIHDRRHPAGYLPAVGKELAKRYSTAAAVLKRLSGCCGAEHYALYPVGTV